MYDSLPDDNKSGYGNDKDNEWEIQSRCQGSDDSSALSVGDNTSGFAADNRKNVYTSTLTGLSTNEAGVK